MGIEIVRIENVKQLKAFIAFPFKLFKNNSFWVPQLNMTEMDTLRKDKNPAFEHCDAEYWLAYKNGEIVGRIAGIINYLANEKWGSNVRFGWIDFIDDIDVARKLLDTVSEWGKSKGMDKIHGPLGFIDMDNEGMLVEGFDKLPTIANIYNFPYYPKHLETLGYNKAEDWVQFEMKAAGEIPPKMEKINKLIEEKYNLRTLTFKKAKHILPYAKSLFNTINSSFSNLYGYSELTEKEIDVLIKSYFSFVNPNFICLVVDKNDQVIGFGITLPSLSKAFQKSKGKIFPFGFIHILRALKKTETIDLYLNGVHPDWQKRGIHSLYYVQLNKAYIKHNAQIAISNPQLETNVNAVRIWDNYEKKPYIRRRCYIKDL